MFAVDVSEVSIFALKEVGLIPDEFLVELFDPFELLELEWNGETLSAPGSGVTELFTVPPEGMVLSASSSVGEVSSCEPFPILTLEDLGFLICAISDVTSWLVPSWLAGDIMFSLVLTKDFRMLLTRVFGLIPVLPMSFEGWSL